MVAKNRNFAAVGSECDPSCKMDLYISDILLFMTWIVLALAAPFFWAISNLFDKYALGKLSKSVPDFIFFGTIGSVLVVLGLLFARGIEMISPILILMAVVGGFLLNYAFIFYAKVLERVDATRVVPIFQTIPVFVLILGYFFFQETISLSQLTGFFVILAGGIFISTSKDVLKGFRINSGFWLLIFASFLMAISVLFSDHVLESVKFLTFFTYDLIGFSLAGFSLFLYKPWGRDIVKGIKEARSPKYLLFLLNDAFDIAGNICSKFALILAPSAALVTVMFGVQPFYLLLLGVLAALFFPNLIKEDVSKRAVLQKFVGIAVIFIGVVLVTWL